MTEIEKSPDSLFDPIADQGTARQDGSPIMLLDLNYTLAENSKAVMNGPNRYKVEVEHYRLWLIDLIRDYRVFIVTARPIEYRDATLARIASEAHGWQPEEAWFKEWNARAPRSKQRSLETYIFPNHGRSDETRYLALESNDDTAKMYAAYGIQRTRARDLEADPLLLKRMIG